MEFVSTIPKWQFALLAITGSLTIISSFYMITKGNLVPFGVVAAVAFLLFLMYKRIIPSFISRPPSDFDRAYDVFRDMEPKDQTRVNPWVGFLQEDVYANKTGPIGQFVGNDDYVKRAPLYPILENGYSGTETGVLKGQCPSKNCKCYPSPDVPGKTVCGYTESGTLIKCPPDCCSEDCDL
jgi:hypothetical protein